MAPQAHDDFPCLKLAMPHWYAIGFAVRSLNLMVLVAGAWLVSVGFMLNSWVLAEVVLVGQSQAIAIFFITADVALTAVGLVADVALMAVGL
ncbi:hypothetical protein Nepgr_003945 [Nepenthes gracilis]|uniref:Uncharacterized protein n=1 Tax=Nepenthes gracilis TaxID=150966 RepID=A0AAD3S0J7_NEPGR|nr:hypothetical protein Nepgr_003945 [Nepenthes gracilis]